MKRTALLLVMAALAVSALAENSEKDAQLGPLGTGVCQSTFTSGNGLSYMTFCTTQNGNVAKFESPSGYNQLHQGGEGYGLCDTTSGDVRYYDWGTYGDSGWQNATIKQPNGPNTFPLTISRTTADGIWTLKQVFSRNTSAPAVKVTMTLQNNSALTRQVLLSRFADIDADGSNAGNWFDADYFGAWGHSLTGLLMRATTLDGISLGGRIVPPGTTDPCNTNIISTPYHGDAATLILWAYYGGNSIPSQKSKTATLEYRAF
jgi:hypothetical protein